MVVFVNKIPYYSSGVVSIWSVYHVGCSEAAPSCRNTFRSCVPASVGYRIETCSIYRIKRVFSPSTPWHPRAFILTLNKSLYCTYICKTWNKIENGREICFFVCLSVSYWTRLSTIEIVSFDFSFIDTVYASTIEFLRIDLVFSLSGYVSTIKIVSIWFFVGRYCIELGYRLSKSYIFWLFVLPVHMCVDYRNHAYRFGFSFIGICIDCPNRSISPSIGWKIFLKCWSYIPTDYDLIVFGIVRV